MFKPMHAQNIGNELAHFLVETIFLVMVAKDEQEHVVGQKRRAEGVYFSIYKTNKLTHTNKKFRSLQVLNFPLQDLTSEHTQSFIWRKWVGRGGGV